jgi:trimeric autotransporter adhesin
MNAAMKRRLMFCGFGILLAFFLAACASQQSARQKAPIPKGIPTDGLVAYYPLEGTADDDSGNDNHGHLYGARSTKDRFGRKDSALTFNGFSQRIDLYNHPLMDKNDSFTITGWLRPLDVNLKRFQIPIGKMNRKEWKYIVLFISAKTDSRKSDFGIAISGMNYSFLQPVEGQWYFFSFGYNKIRNDYRIYLSNNANVLMDVGAAIKNRPFTEVSSTLMAGCGDLDEFFNGDLDDICLYNRELSRAEVESIFKAE